MDCFSEILDEKRVFGILGKPFPWQKTFIKNYHKVTSSELIQKMNDTK